jgi:hypothetical protein
VLESPSPLPAGDPRGPDQEPWQLSHAGAARPTPLAHVREWLLRETALGQARKQQLRPGQRAALRAAVQALELAVRGIGLEGYRAGPPLAATLMLYQEAVWWALQAAKDGTSAQPASLAEACAEHAALLGALAGGEQQFARLRAEFLEPARHSFQALDEESQVALIISARSFATALIAHVGQPDAHLSKLLRDRWLRPLLVLASIACIAFGVRVALAPRDVAAGKAWTASSADWDFPISGKTDKFGNDDMLFHTKAEDNPWLMVDLSKVEPVRGVAIENRHSCCQDRAVPLIVEVSGDAKTWREVARNTAVFTDWKVLFRPQPARFVRLRVPRQTVFHLRRVQVLR